MAQSFADKLKNIVNEIKNKFNTLTSEDQTALRNEVKQYINNNPYYGSNSLHRRILDPRHIYEEDTPYLFAFIHTYNDPDKLHWLAVRMIIDYMLDMDNVMKQLNDM